jgi:hypothetical protein
MSFEVNPAGTLKSGMAIPSRSEKVDPEVVKVILDRLRTSDKECKRGDEALEEIRQKLKQPAPK